MRLGIFLFVLILLGVVFDKIESKEESWYPPDGILIFYPLKPYKMHVSSHAYYIIEHVTIISLAILPFFFKRNKFLYAFIALEALDLFDYLLTGNRTWFYYDKIPITFNIVKALCFGIYLSYEFISIRNTASINA
jgi:hypothetical protein